MAAVLSVCPVAIGAPALIVPPDPGTGWWIRKNVLRPISTSVAGVGLADINTYLTKHSGGMTPQRICYVEGLAAGNIIGLLRETQAEIDETMREHPGAFRRMIVQGGKQFIVQTGVYEDCEGGTSSFVIVTEGGKLHSFLPQEARFAWLPDRGKDVAGISSCFLCGDMTELHYDSRRDRFYTEYVGD